MDELECGAPVEHVAGDIDHVSVEPGDLWEGDVPGRHEFVLDLPLPQFPEDQLGLSDRRVIGEDDNCQQASQPESVPRLKELALLETRRKALLADYDGL